MTHEESNPVPEPGSKQKTKKPLRRRVSVWTLGLVGVLCALVLSVPFLLSTGWVQATVTSWLNDNIETPVHFERMDVSWRDGIRIAGLRVDDNEGRPLLEAPLVEIDAPLLPLLSRRLLVSKFVLHEPVFHIAKDEDGVNTTGVVKRRKVRRKRRRQPEEPEAPEVVEHTVLPDIRVPVEIHGATLVFTSQDGEVRQEGIEFAGTLSTREGPTTFRLDVPDGPDSGLFVEGSVSLFDAEGVLLDSEEREVNTKIVLARLDAAAHADLVALFLGDARCAGVVEGRIEARSKGSHIDASMDLTVRGFAVGDALAADSAADGGVLLVKGRVARTGDGFSVSGLDVRAEGLSVTADLTGSLEDVRGKADMDIDLGRAADALRAMGIEVSSAFGGRVQGGLDFPGGSAGGDGRVIVSGFQAPSPVDGRPPVVIEHADLAFRLAPFEGGLRLEQALARIPGLEATAAGTLGKDGGLDVLAQAHGDLGAALAKVRDLGLLPRDLALNGQLDAKVRVRRTGGEGSHGIGLEIETFTLTDPGVNVTVAGTRGEDGTLDVRAEGRGNLERLFAASGTTTVGGADVGAIRGQFDFLATVKGPADRLDLVLDRLTVKGALDIDAQGRMDPDGALGGSLRADGDVRDAVTLLRRMGLLESELPLEGRLSAVAEVAGTRDAPVVPVATLRVTGGQVNVDASGSLDAAGAVDATVTLDSQVDALVQLAHAAGYVKRVTTPGGTISMRANVSGNRDEIQVPTADVTLAGGISGVLRGSLDAEQRLTVGGELSGALRSLAALESAWSGEDARPLEGTFDIQLDARGPRDAPEFTVQKAIVRARGLVVQADAIRTADGAVDAHYDAAGPVADLIDFIRQAGYGELVADLPVSLAGALSAKGAARLAGDEVQGSVTARIERLNVSNRSGGAAANRPGFSESRLDVVTEAYRYDLRKRRLAPMRVTIDMADAPFHADIGLAAANLESDVRVDAEFRGGLGPLARLASMWTGAEPPTLNGTFDGKIAAYGPRDRLAIEIPKLAIRADALTADVTATRDASGSGKATAAVRGPLADVLGLARALGYAQDVRATGDLDARLDGTLAGDVASAALEAVATNLVVLEPDVGGAPFREASLRISAPSLRYALEAQKLEPTQVTISMQGAKFVANVALEEGPAPAGAEDPTRRVTADGRLDVDSSFSTNHPELFPDVTLTTLSGPFRFDGDVSRGLDGATTWTGGFDLNVTGATAPYARIASARAVGRFDAGALVLDPVTANVNEGTATAKARIMLAGGPPYRHTAELHAKDVLLDGELAPLIARVSPLFATGEGGKTGGRASVDVELTALGTKSQRIKRTMTGEGVLVLKDAYVESSGWLGKVLDLTGMGPRLTVADATVPFSVREGKVVTADLPIDAVGMAMKLGGEVTLDGDLDYRFLVKPTGESSSFSKYAQLLDKDGFLPLRLDGDLGSPDLKLPSIKDLLGGGLGGFIDRLRGGDDDDDDEKKKEQEAEEERKRRRRERRKKARERGDEEVPPPPPPLR